MRHKHNLFSIHSQFKFENLVCEAVFPILFFQRFLRFRQYETAEEASLLLPLPQALAVAAAADPGKELSIGYVERAGECRAVWLSD